MAVRISATLLLLIVASSSALRLERTPKTRPNEALTGRRAAIFGACVALMQTSQLAVLAQTPDNLAGILERAEKGTLKPTPVLARARAEKLVNPKDIPTCKQLNSLIETDSEVLYDLLPASRSYVKSKMDEFQDRQLLQSMLSDEEFVRARVSKQLSALAEERSERQCP